MASLLKLGLHGGGDAVLEREVAGIHGVRERRRRKTARGPARRLDGLLDIHAEIDDVHERLHGVDGLIVAAGRAGDEEGLTIFHHQRALQGAARALAGSQRIGMTFDQGVVIAAAVENESEVAHHDLGAEARCAGWA